MKSLRNAAFTVLCATCWAITSGFVLAAEDAACDVQIVGLANNSDEGQAATAAEGQVMSGLADCLWTCYQYNCVNGYNGASCSNACGSGSMSAQGPQQTTCNYIEAGQFYECASYGYCRGCKPPLPEG